MTNRLPDRKGFTLIELMVAIVIVAIVGASLASLYTGQLEFQRMEDAMRDSRSSARAALNVLRSDMRMLESGGAVVSAAAEDITIRVPYSFGIVCASSASDTDVSLLPADTTMYANAGFSGWAWRDSGTGDWTYLEGGIDVSEPGTGSCDAEDVEVLDGGRVVRLDPGVNGLAVGTPVMLFQRIRYRFASSNAVPGREGLFRTVEATAQESELVAPFTNTARFRFYTDWDTAQDAVPADLSTIVGFEINLNTESVADSPRLDAPEPFSLVTSIFFKNVSG
jgi:prepilin-type N-terminal cleavage/methylation domain-containing protein